MLLEARVRHGPRADAHDADLPDAVLAQQAHHHRGGADEVAETSHPGPRGRLGGVAAVVTEGECGGGELRGAGERAGRRRAGG